MNVIELITDLREQGVHLWVDGDNLRFRAPRGVLTVARREKLAAHKPAVIEYLAGEEAQLRISPAPAAAHERFPLTQVQSSYLIGRNQAYDFGGIACTSYLEVLYADVEPARLEQAWNELVQRHDMLRATVHGDGYQRVATTVPAYRIQVTDVRGATESEIDIVRDLQRDDLLSQTTNTEQWPLFALRVTRTDAGSVLHLLAELLVLDAASVQRLLVELGELLDASPSQKSAPEITFRDYVMGLQRLRNGSQYQRDREYWQARLDELPPAPELATDAVDDPSDLATTVEFERLHHRLTAAELADLTTAAAEHGLTASGVILAAYAEVVGRWSRHRQFTLNLPVFNRLPLHPDIDRVLGDFTAVNLLSVDLDADDSFEKRARAISAQLFTDLDHRLFDGVEVLGELTRRAGKPVLMPVVFTSTVGGTETKAPANGEASGSGKILRGMTRTPQVWLDCQVTPAGDDLLLAWDVRRGVFPADMAEDAFGAFADLVTRLAKKSDTWNERCPVSLPAAQRERRAAYNDTAVPRKPRLMHQRILSRATTNPDEPAIIHRGRTVTYAELARLATASAASLSAAGVERGDRVGILMEKGPEQVVATLGALMVEAAYVPIEVNQPPARRERIFESAGIEVVLTQSWLHEAGEVPSALRVVSVDKLRDADIKPDAGHKSDPEATAYVIYTSGSTGEPKGVVITHRAATNTIDDINERFAIGSKDRVLGVANLGFDLSVWDIFGVLTAGGTLVLPEQQRASDPSHWTELIDRHSITVWNSVPGQLQMMQDVLDTTHEYSARVLRLALLSGDWIPVDLPDRARAHNSDLKVVSLGGATEASIWSIHHPIDQVDPEWRSIPYGVPLSNQTMHVLDDAWQDCPDHVTGEIYIGGLGLAEGYLGREELTAERFVRHPQTGAPLYRTGDLGRMHPDGTIEFLGREDTQVKIRGHRVELGEIESALRRHPAVADAVAILDDGGPTARLTGFVEIAVDSASDHDTSRDSVADEVLEASVGAAAAVRSRIDGESFVALMRAVDEMSVLSIAARLRGDGLFDSAGQSHDIIEIATATGVSERQHGLLNRWMSALVHAEAVIQDPDTGRYRDLVASDPAAVQDAWRRIDELNEIVGYGSETLDYIRTCSSRLDELLRGDLDVRELLFPAGKAGAAHAVYRTNLVASSVHRIVIATVRAVATKTPHRLRMLEVGGGIAGTSTELIPKLAEFEPDYHFTDVSEFFLNEARRTFADYPWVRYGRFDINTDAQEQNLAPNSVDVILCANVLHNSRNADEVLARLRDLLAPGAWLVFLEPTRQHNYALLVSMEFEFFSELTQFTDVRAGKGQAFFTRDQWSKLLEDAGADRIQVLPAEDDPLATSGQGVFIARFKGERRPVTDNDLTDHVTMMLPDHMVPDEIRLLDTLPRSANGKVDRSALKVQASTYPSGQVDELQAPPANDIERRIAELWEDMLGISPIGRDQNFYELGGDSLLLSQMIGQLREREPQAAAIEWQKMVRHMLREPTVAGLAAQLKPTKAGATEVDQSESAVMSLGGDPDDASGTWVLVHDGTGTLQPYQALIPHLRAAHPGALIGLQVSDTRRYLGLPPEVVIIRQAADYARELLERGRHFRVIGYSVGGLLATEIARNLTEAGAKVDELTVISSYQPPAVHDELLVDYIFAQAVGADPIAAGFPADVETLNTALRAIFDKTPDRVPADALTRLSGPLAPLAAKFQALAATPRSDRLAAVQAASAKAGSNEAGWISPEQFRETFDIFAQSLRAVGAYRPEPYFGPARILRNVDSNELLLTGEDICKYWSQICLGTLVMEDVPGDHFSCMAATNAVSLSRKITLPLQGFGSQARS